MTERNRLIQVTRDEIAVMAKDNPRMIRAIEQLFLTSGGAEWIQLDFTDSNLTDIETRNHNDLQFTRLIKTVDYPMVGTDDMVLADATAGNLIITLPGIESPGVYSVKKTDSSANTVTVLPQSGLIDGEVSMTIYQQNDCISSVSDGVNWSIE